jgi:hypothetical protein
MAANALTIRDRAAHTGEGDAAPVIASASWIASLICFVVMIGIAGRLRSTPLRMLCAGATRLCYSAG